MGISSGGRTVLLGDAAHAMAPFMGLGAQSAMLDARALAAELVREQPLAEALLAYQAQRKAPCEQIISRANLEGTKLTSFGVSAAFRDMAVPLTHQVHLYLMRSQRWSMRKVGAVLVELLTLGHIAAERLSMALQREPGQKCE